jgi:hypothetical protein
MFPEMHLSVRLLIIVLAAVALAWLVWLQARREERHPTLIGFLAVAVAVLGFFEYRAQAAEARYGAIASELAKREVGVRCQGLFGHLVDIGQELGTVQFDAEGDPADKTDLKRDACTWLREFEKDQKINQRSAMAVHVVAHEAFHLRGWTDEAVTECYGVQHTAFVARRLGASADKAQALARIYWEFVYPDLPDEYRTDDCGNGKRLDLNKDSDIWP